MLKFFTRLVKLHFPPNAEAFVGKFIPKVPKISFMIFGNVLSLNFAFSYGRIRMRR